MTNSSPKIFITRKLLPKGEELIGHFPSIEWEQWPQERPPTPQELLDRCKDKDGLLCMVTDKIDAVLMDQCPNLKIISNHAVGVDNIDVASATKRKIYVGNTPDVLTQSTAELTLGLILSVARKIPWAQEEIKKGLWKTWGPRLYLGSELKNKTLGILGMGRIGQAVANMAHYGFGMHVIYHNRKPLPNSPYRFVLFEELLKESDILSIHADLNSTNRGLFNQENFLKMKKGSFFINTSRGGIHCEEGLFEALSSGHLSGAGLDVTNPEPMNMQSPLLGLSQVVVTPHIGSATWEARNLMSERAVKNIVDALVHYSFKDMLNFPIK